MFSSNRLLNYLVFISSWCIDFINNDSDNIESWGPTGMLQESIKNLNISDINFFPKIIGDHKFNSRVGLKEICLKQENVSFLHKNVANLYISYKLDTWSKDLNTNFTLVNSLFGAVKLTKNAGLQI